MLPKYPRLEERLRNESEVKKKKCQGYLVWIFKERNVVVKEVNPPPLLRVLTMVLAALSISDISMNAQYGPRRPKLLKYPPCMFGVQKRSFCKSWLGQFVWLEYNATKVVLAV